MNVFKRISEILRPEKLAETPSAWQIPLGLSPTEWDTLKDLRASDEFAIFQKALDESVKFTGEALLGASTNESLHFYRGLIHGLRKAGTLLDELKQSEDAYLNEQRKHLPRDDSSARRVATFGSPAWRSASRPQGKRPQVHGN